MCPNATGEKQGKCFRRNKQAEPKQKHHPVVDESGGESKVQCCKEQYCIGTWNVRHMNQGKLDMIKQQLLKCFTQYASEFGKLSSGHRTGKG